jgi:hypothetical protein
VIPTRNRAGLAMAAVDGLLAEGGAEVRVVVSDNSTDEAQVEQLASFCRRRDDARLGYLRSPPLAMAAHWDWALQHTLERSDSTHISIHYDRKVPKPGRMRLLLDAMERHPDEVITYSIDHITQDPPRYFVWQPPCTGELYEIETARVVRMVTEGRIDEMGHSFPILSNCAVPTHDLVDIRERFGDICISTSPDAAFTFRFCALAKTYLHLDDSLSVAYAIHRSSGAGHLSGKQTDYADFRTTWGDRPWLDAVPLAGVDLGWNMLFHEYELARKDVGDAFPPLPKEGYLRGLAYGLTFVRDDARRDELAALLEAEGWRAPPPGEPRPTALTLRGRLHAALNALRRQLVLLRARALDVRPAHITGYPFRSERRALFYAKLISRRPVPDHEGLAWIDESAR